MIARRFGRADRKAMLMGEMIARLDIDIPRAAQRNLGATLGRAARACRLCARTDLCQAWLSGSTHLDRREFCPNAAVFDGMPRRGDTVRGAAGLMPCR